MTEVTYRPRKHLSVSTLLSFTRCPRRYFYSKCGLREPEDALAPSYGTAMHKAIPELLQTDDLGAALTAFDSVWDHYATIQAERGEFDTKRNRKCAERLLKHFQFTHSAKRSLYTLVPPPTGTIQIEEKTSDYEVPWVMDIGLPIPLVGRFDSMCVHRDTGEPWVWELKTTSRLNARFFEAHEMAVQNLTYALVANTLMEEKVSGVMVEGVLVDKTKVDNMVQPVLVMDHHLEDMLRWLRVTGARLLDAEARYMEAMEFDSNPENYFEKNFSGCTPYTHFYMPGFRCEFADLCRVPDYRLATSLYRVVEEQDFLTATVNDDAKKL